MSTLTTNHEPMVRLTKRPIKLEIPEFGICIGESHHERGFTMKPRRERYTKIYYILDGSADCIMNDTPNALSKEELFVIPKGMTHYLRDKENAPLSLYILAIEHTALNQLQSFKEQIEQLDEFAKTQPKPLTPHDYMAYELPRKIRRILYEQRVNAAGYVPVIQANMLQIIVALNRIYSHTPIARHIDEAKPSVTRIQQVAKYIDVNFYQPISVEQMARMACLSVRQFTNQFKAVYGVTFVQYLHFLRIRFAQKLLAETDQKIISICFAAGFNDLAHFYRIFKKQTGYSPRRYRLSSQTQDLEGEDGEME